MSVNLGSTTNIFGGLLIPMDERSSPAFHTWNAGRVSVSLTPWFEGLNWAYSNGLGGQLGSCGIGCDQASDAGYWNPIDSQSLNVSGLDDTGASTQNVLVGQTFNGSGVPLANCKVTGFVTATNVIVGSVTSDNAGYYMLPTPYSTSTAHYVTAFLAGSPDVSGMSDNTLMPVVP